MRETGTLDNPGCIREEAVRREPGICEDHIGDKVKASPYAAGSSNRKVSGNGLFPFYSPKL